MSNSPKSFCSTEVLDNCWNLKTIFEEKSGNIVMMIWPYRTMLFNFKTSLKCSYMYTMYLTHSHPSFPLSSSFIAPTNLPLLIMSFCFYNHWIQSVSPMWVWKAGADSQHPNPKTNSPFLGSHELLINPQLEVALGSFPSFHAGSFNWLDLVKSSVQVSWCPVQRTAFHNSAPILTVIFFPLTLQHGSLNLEDSELQHVLLATQSLTLSTFNSYVYLHQPIPDTVRRFFDNN